MHLRIAALALALFAAGAARADEDFSHKLTPEEFQAAGLNKLTPAELAQLDALIHAREQGVVATATAQATQQVTAQVTATVRAQTQEEDRQAEEKKAASTSFIDKVKVMLKPGTEINYTTLDVNILPPYDGYDKGYVFNFDNGQHWQVVDNSSDFRRKTTKPLHARIVPGSMGNFFLVIDGGGRPKVKFLYASAAVVPPSP